jgi:predicted nucleic acid-binding protein
MILVDSSVWIDHLGNVFTRPVQRLRQLVKQERILIGDLILCEVLRGLRSERRFELVALADPELAVKAADNYRLLRRRGITIRTTVDLIVGTFCIERGHALLHSDRDFEPMERFLGLQAV